MSVFFNKIATKVALSKAGLSSSSFNFSSFNSNNNNSWFSSSTAASENSPSTTLPSNPRDVANGPNGAPQTSSNNKILASLNLPSSWTEKPPPPEFMVASLPAIGLPAPSHELLRFPTGERRPCLVVFLRWGGCPFLPPLLTTLINLAKTHPLLQIHLLTPLTPSAQKLHLAPLLNNILSYRPLPPNIILHNDPRRELASLWGLGLASTWHVMNPWTGWEFWRVSKESGGDKATGLGAEAMVGEKEEGVGNLWMMGGAWGIDAQGSVKWGGPQRRADEVMDFEGAVGVLGV